MVIYGEISIITIVHSLIDTILRSCCLYSYKTQRIHNVHHLTRLARFWGRLMCIGGGVNVFVGEIFCILFHFDSVARMKATVLPRK